MKCFEHSSVDSFGLCKICLRGLCEECAIEVEFGLVCSEDCNSRFQILNSHLDKDLKIRSYVERPGPPSSSYVIYAAFALLFLGHGLFEFFSVGRNYLFSMVAGFCMCFLFIYQVYLHRRFKNRIGE